MEKLVQRIKNEGIVYYHKKLMAFLKQEDINFNSDNISKLKKAVENENGILKWDFSKNSILIDFTIKIECDFSILRDKFLKEFNVAKEKTDKIYVEFKVTDDEGYVDIEDIEKELNDFKLIPIETNDKYIYEVEKYIYPEVCRTCRYLYEKAEIKEEICEHPIQDVFSYDLKHKALAEIIESASRANYCLLYNRKGV